MDKNKMKKLADHVVRESTEHTADGRWKISYVELRSRFGIDVSDVNENGKMLEKELRQREEINELIMTEDAIEMTCHLEYCPNCCEGGINGALLLTSFIGMRSGMEEPVPKTRRPRITKEPDTAVEVTENK